MKRIVRLFVAALLPLAGLVLVSSSVGASSFTVSPWAYACGHTTFANPATATATCSGSSGTATASYVGGVLTLSKNGPTSSDLASGATIGGLVTLSAASADLVEGSYCQAGAPRLNVVTDNGTVDGLIHFFGCAANNSGGHVSFNLSAAGDGAGNGGVSPTDKVLEIDIVQDEGTCIPVGDCQDTPAMLTNLSFTGNAPAPTPNPCATPAPTATPTPTPPASSARVAANQSAPAQLTAYVQAACPTHTPKPPTTGVGYDANHTPLALVVLVLLAGIAINGSLFLAARRR